MRAPILFLSSLLLFQLGCEDDEPPVAELVVHSFDVDAEGLVTLDVELHDANGHNTVGNGRVKIVVVGAPAGADEAALEEARVLARADAAVVDSRGRRQLEARLPTPEPLPDEEVYVKLAFDTTGGDAPNTPWVWVDAPATLRPDALRTAADERSRERLAANVEPTDAQRENESVLTDYIASLGRAVGAVPEGEIEAPRCETSDARDASPRGYLVWEDWARRVADTDSPIDLPACPRQEDREHSFVDRRLCETTILSRRLSYERAAVYGSDDPVAELAEDLRDDGPWLRVLRIDELVEPAMGASDGQRHDFTPGRIDATVIVVDRHDGTIVCTAKVRATNSEHFERQPDGRDPLLEDLVVNFGRALVPATPIAPSSP